MTNWNDIVREHGPPTYRAAWRILRHAQDCEDVMQEVFIEAHGIFIRTGITHPRTLLNRMVTFRAIDALRKRKKREEVSGGFAGGPEPVGNTVSPETAAIEREEEQRLRGIVAELPSRQAAVFCLVHFEELSHNEIADTLNISRGAVAMALHKARTKLRELLAGATAEDQQ